MYLSLAGLLLHKNAQKQEAATKGSFVVSTASAGNGSSIPRASMAMNLHFYMCWLL
jgi:hypothetical protein